jgi:hypothetical protein
VSVSAQTYSVSSDGRVLLSGGEPFILYLVDTNKAFLLDQSANAALGFVQPQAVPPAGFDNTAVSGTLTAATISPTITQNSNEVGLATLDGAGAFQTVEDVSNQSNLVLNELTTGNYTISANGRGIVSGINITLAGFGLWIFPLLIAAWLWFTPRKATRSKPRPNLAMLCFSAWVAAVPSACPPPKINELVFYVVSPTEAVMIHLRSADAAPVVAIFEP